MAMNEECTVHQYRDIPNFALNHPGDSPRYGSETMYFRMQLLHNIYIELLTKTKRGWNPIISR
jgi:hypothetical protein